MRRRLARKLQFKQIQQEIMSVSSLPKDLVTQAMPKQRYEDIFASLVQSNWPNVIFSLVMFFFFIHSFFAFVLSFQPLAIGTDGRGEVSDTLTFVKLFIYSIQSTCGIGFGSLYPHTIWANVILLMQELTALIYIPMFIGVVYNKFARPKPTAFLEFTRHCAVHLDKDEKTPILTMRIMNKKRGSILDATVQCHFTIGVGVDRITVLLPIEHSEVVFFGGVWTISHRILPNSFLANMTWTDLDVGDAKITIIFTGTDSGTLGMLYHTHTYDIGRILLGRRFVPCFRPNGGDTKIMDNTLLGTTVTDRLWERVYKNDEAAFIPEQVQDIDSALREQGSTRMRSLLDQ
ncbi:hypothetical protein PCE1_004290 [Barthelona sp. PCE]